MMKALLTLIIVGALSACDLFMWDLSEFEYENFEIISNDTVFKLPVHGVDIIAKDNCYSFAGISGDESGILLFNRSDSSFTFQSYRSEFISRGIILDTFNYIHLAADGNQHIIERRGYDHIILKEFTEIYNYV